MVHQVSATDPDEGRNSKIVYSFSNTQDRNTFTLNSATGQIYTRGSLDHEIQSIYNVSTVFSYMHVILVDYLMY